MANIVVSGSSGFIGQHLVRKLKRLGHKVYPLDTNYKPDPVNLTSYIDTKRHFEELTDHKTKPIDVVFDLATQPLPKSLIEPYSTVYRIYCMGTVICELAREGYFKTLVHVSSSEVFQITTPYAAAKDAQDKLIQSYVNCFGIDARIARPFNTYGEGQDLGAIIPNTIKRILKKKPPIIHGNGSQMRDFVYVSDTVNGIISVWQENEKGDDINITTEMDYSVEEIVKKISELMNYKGKIIHTKERTGNTFDIHGRNTCNYEPKVSLEEGLKRTIKWWKRRNFTL